MIKGALMDTKQLQKEFHECIKKALIAFSQTEENKDVYALVFDCDSDVGMISLRYNNLTRFENTKREYADDDMVIYGLHGLEYSVGEFAFIDYQKTDLVAHFTASYYYHRIGDYFREDEPIEEIKDDFEDIFWHMIEDTIQQLQSEVHTLGIHTTKDIVMFYCDHDQSQEDRDIMISKTVDAAFMKKLIEKTK